MFSKVKKHLPSIFSELEEDGDKEINEDKYEPSSHDIIPKHILNVVKNLFEDHSLFDKPVHGRIMKITIVKRLPSAKLSDNSSKEEISKEASVRQLARQYAAYKLAAMRYLDSQNKLDEDMMFNALIQNR
jgi:hypothetical protein